MSTPKERGYTHAVMRLDPVPTSPDGFSMQWPVDAAYAQAWAVSEREAIVKRNAMALAEPGMPWNLGVFPKFYVVEL